MSEIFCLWRVKNHSINYGLCKSKWQEEWPMRIGIRMLVNGKKLPANRVYNHGIELAWGERRSENYVGGLLTFGEIPSEYLSTLKKKGKRFPQHIWKIRDS